MAGQVSAEEAAESQDATTRAIVLRMLRRKLGFWEDRDFDTMIRMKHLHIVAFSLLGLLTMMLIQIVTWSVSSSATLYADAYVDDPAASATLLNCMYLAQAVISFSTIVTVVLIAQKYRLLLTTKRAEWSGASVMEVEAYNGDAALSNEERDYYAQSYGFFTSWLFLQFAAEVAIHLPHPVLWLASASSSGNPRNAWFKVLQVVMFARLYLIPHVVHLHHPVFKERFHIVNSSRYLSSVGYRVQPTLTLKVLFYEATSEVLVAVFALLMVSVGFSVFSLERLEGPLPEGVTDGAFSSFWNCVWFSYITATTIGYGEYAPVTLVGRTISAVCASIGITTVAVFTGVLVGRVSLTKEQKQGVEFITTQRNDEKYREASSQLRRAFVQDVVLPKFQGKPSRVPHGHKANRIYNGLTLLRAARRHLQGAVMQADDAVLYDKITALDNVMEAVDREVVGHVDQTRAFEDGLHQRMKNLNRDVLHFVSSGNVPV